MQSALNYLKSETVLSLKKIINRFKDFESANRYFQEFTGIVNFFNDQYNFENTYRELLTSDTQSLNLQNKREFGDFQTPEELTDLVCTYLKQSEISPEVIFEPTFGQGSFLISALRQFPEIQDLIGVEIFEPYCRQTRFLIFEFFLKSSRKPKAAIHLFQADIFNLNYNKIFEIVGEKRLLILGNPPWVTNAELGRRNSENLPRKYNRKAQNGLDALTGASNFDLGEAVLLDLLKHFSSAPATIAMLVKDAVIKNIIHDLPRSEYAMEQIEALKINARKYFNASVQASLFHCRLNAKKPELFCTNRIMDKTNTIAKHWGWAGDKFVANLGLYQKYAAFDEVCPFTWRQGMKHDCAKIMELVRTERGLVNGLNQPVKVESTRLYGLVKSSDLKSLVVSETNRQVIVPQDKLGDDTSRLENESPRLYQYLRKNEDFFTRRKSKIYNNMPPFSVFGIGDYTFAPFKVAISGLYKRSTFSLLLPAAGKPLLLDDTCYFLGFDRLADAAFVWAILNGEAVQNLLAAITFQEAKRPYTKRILMRLAISKIIDKTNFSQIQAAVSGFDPDIAAELDENDWVRFKSDSAISQQGITQKYSVKI